MNKNDEEENLDPRLYFENRSKVLLALKESRDPFPYPHKYDVKLTLGQFRREYDAKLTEKGQILEGEVTSIAGRVFSIRSMGAGLMFYDVQGDGTKIQVMANAKNHTDSEYDF